MNISKLREFLDKHNLIVIPRSPTGSMQAAAYYAGGVGDCGGVERKNFVDEWDASVNQWLTGEKPTGLLRLVYPVEWDNGPELDAIRDKIYPKDESTKA